MDEIIYLIKQAYLFYEENNIELSSNYDLDAWISLKELLIKKNINKISNFNFKSNKTIIEFINNIGLSYGKEETDIEILESMISFFEFTDEELIQKNRALADCYYRINDYQKCDELYKSFIEKNINNTEYYYAYALTLYNREEYAKSISILEDGIENSKNSNNTYVLASFELLIDIYEILDEEENLISTKKRLSNYKGLS